MVRSQDDFAEPALPVQIPLPATRREPAARKSPPTKLTTIRTALMRLLQYQFVPGQKISYPRFRFS